MAGNSEVKVVCDPTLTGLAQRLHSCGVDVLLLNSIDLVEKAAQLHFRWLPNKSYCVISHNLDEQVTEVLQHLHVSAAENLVLRCEVCNGDEYFNIHPAEMLYARQQMSTAPSDHGDNDSCGTMLDPTDVMKHEFDHLNLESLSLPNGLPLRPHSIPMTFFKDTTVFHVCANCGKIYSNKMKT